MEFWSRIFRVAAIAMVMFVAVELVTCDFLPDSSCHASQSTADKSAPDGSDNCICCCAHATVMPILAAPVQVTSVWIEHDDSIQRPVLTSLHIEHPPQLS